MTPESTSSQLATPRRLPGLETVVCGFEMAWRRGECPDLDAALAGLSGAERAEALVELAHAELELRLKAGESARVEEYLRRYPELSGQTAVVLGLIEAEHRQRGWGEPAPALEEYLRRFPHLAAQLRTLAWDPTAITPEAGHDRTPPGQARGEAALDLRDYELLDRLGRGGMGEVFRATDPALGRDLAIKVLRPDWRGDAEAEGRFAQEARVTGALQHPNIVPVHNLGRLPDGRLYFTMKLVRGRTLAEMLAEGHGPGRQPELLGVFEKVCQAVAFAHSRGVIHRDLKPANVMVGAFGEVQVMDWGLAKELMNRGRTPSAGDVPPGADAPCSPTSATQAGSVLGTPAYMAPEQARGETGAVDARADVFGLGAMLCEILTGLPPYEQGDAADVLRRAAAGELADAFARLEGCGADAELVQLAWSCLAPDATDRLADAGEVAAAMAGYQQQLQQRLRQMEMERTAAQVRASEERKRRRATLLAAAAVVLVVVGGSGAGLWYALLRMEQAHRHEQTEKTAAQAVRQARQIREDLQAQLAKDGLFRLLDRPSDWKHQLDLAREALRHARDLADGPEGPFSPDLHAEIRALQAWQRGAEADREMALQLEKIREDHSTIVGGKFNNAGTVRAYLAAFRRLGLSLRPGQEAEDAALIRRSAIRAQLLASLDDCALRAGPLKDPDLRGRLLRVARRADPDPWRDKVRDPNSWSQPRRMQALVHSLLADRAAFGRLSRQMLVLIGETLIAREGKAEVWLREAQALHPGDFWLNFQLGSALQWAKPGEAAGYFRTALAVRPQSTAAWTNLGSALNSQKDYQGAEVAARKALEINQQLAKPWDNLGSALDGQGNLKGAEAAHRKALAIDPQYAMAWANLGNNLLDQKKLEGAVQAYQKALAINPLYPAWNNLGGTLYLQKDYRGAEAAFDRWLAIEPQNARAWYCLGLVRGQQKNPKGAEAACRKAVALDPRSAPAWCQLGVALREQGDSRGAVAAYTRALEVDPHYAMAWYNLSNVRLSQNDYKGAEEACKKALAIDPQDALVWRSRWTGKWEVRIDARDARLWSNLGLARRGLGDPKGAEAACRKALEINPRFTKAWHNLGTALLDQKDFQGAIVAFRQAVAIDRGLLMTWGALGVTLESQGHFAEAGACFERVLKLSPPEHPYYASSLDHLRKCRRLLSLAKRLPLVLQGAETNPTEQLVLAGLCEDRLKRYGDAVRLYAAAFAREPPSAEAVRRGLRYQAARAAALGAAGLGNEQLDASRRAELAAQALAWLRADLNLLRTATFRDAAKGQRQSSAQEVLELGDWLRLWQADSQLAGLRSETGLARRTADEQKHWRQFWADVGALAARADACFTEQFRTEGALTDRDKEHPYAVKLTAGKTYVIEMSSKAFDALLRLEDDQGHTVAENDDIQPGIVLDSRIVFSAARGGTYRILATSPGRRGTGTYMLRLCEFRAPGP
jgi:tetratricopeptide (TPR) repeat protein